MMGCRGHVGPQRAGGGVGGILCWRCGWKAVLTVQEMGAEAPNCGAGGVMAQPPWSGPKVRVEGAWSPELSSILAMEMHWMLLFLEEQVNSHVCGLVTLLGFLQEQK